MLKMSVQLTSKQKEMLEKCPHLKPVANYRDQDVLCDDTTEIEGIRPYGPYILRDDGRVQDRTTYWGTNQ